MSAVPVILITGAARRIGAGLARVLHARGCNVVIHYRQSADAAKALQAELCAQRPHSAHILAADLGTARGCAEAIAAALNWQGRLDGLVNNASTFVRSALGEVDEAHWAYLIDGNLKAAFFCSQYAAPALRQSGGAIVNVCDVRTDRPLPGFSVYTAAKAGIVSLTRSLALELAPHVRVNAISPGSLTWPEDDTFNADERTRIEASIPLARIGDGNDIGRVAYFLLRDADYVTGQVIAVDGGAGLASP
ncbi:MAG: pteridine reductase [Betaproteobacteria bacterium]|nr:pteridine reductase [Betaproteobacteria bacterium]